jgi:hypothetical protein
MKIWKRTTEKNEVKQYLLGNLPEKSRERLERRVLNEAEINEEVLAAEDELIDQYLVGRLDAEERRQFESYFLLPNERRRKLRFGRTLRAYLDSVAATGANQDVANGTLVRLRWLTIRPVLAASLFLIICFGVLGTVWLINHARTGNNRILAITLDPGSSRASGGKIQRIEMPASYDAVEVQLEMGSNEYGSYEVELLRERQSVTSYKSLHVQNKAGRSVLVVVIPANVLSPGDYALKLSGATNSGQIEFKDEYQLRVLPAR